MNWLDARFSIETYLVSKAVARWRSTQFEWLAGGQANRSGATRWSGKNATLVSCRKWLSGSFVGWKIRRKIFFYKSATFCSWEIGNWMKRQMFSSGEIGLTWLKFVMVDESEKRFLAVSAQRLAHHFQLFCTAPLQNQKRDGGPTGRCRSPGENEKSGIRREKQKYWLAKKIKVDSIYTDFTCNLFIEFSRTFRPGNNYQIFF